MKILISITLALTITLTLATTTAAQLTIQQYTPNPQIINIDPPQLPTINEGETTQFSITIHNTGTQGTISVTCTSTAYSIVPLTSTSTNIEANNTTVIKFEAHALNVMNTKQATIQILAQGQGGTDTKNITGTILDLEGYTPNTEKATNQIDTTQTIAIAALVATVCIALGVIILRKTKTTNPTIS
ncbi:MAG: hypothetical protein NWF06_00785 [Candidatus Bathyarchaeota archaeon]|nr:hypothetical protein [Candidatus Bathyarchaeum sp.]